MEECASNTEPLQNMVSARAGVRLSISVIIQKSVFRKTTGDTTRNRPDTNFQ